MTSILIERDICHQCEISKPYKELATCKNEEGRTVFYTPITCLNCFDKKNFIEWYKCNCLKCEAKKENKLNYVNN